MNATGNAAPSGHGESFESEANWRADQEFSFYAAGTVFLRNRWRIARWMLLGGIVAVIWIALKPAMYVASASFIPQGTDASRSGLASLAGQLGVSLPTTNQSLSPDFYTKLLKSRVILHSIAEDTVTVPELGGRRVKILELLDAPNGSTARREELATKRLIGMINPSVTRTTGVVEFAVKTRWPSVSFAIANSLLNGVNEFNQRTRQGQATAERKFVEGRLEVASGELRAAEDRLETFLRTNRQFASSPELTFERDRLQRSVALQQQVFTSLTQSYEEVRIREVRDTPVITVIESPVVPSFPEPSRRVLTLLLGLLLGAAIGSLLSFSSEALARGRKDGDSEAEQFVDTLGEIKGEVLGRVRWIRERIAR